MSYAPQPSWSLVHEPGQLLLHAGSDELFLIEDVDDATAQELLALWREEVIHPQALSAEAAGVFEQLKTAGIVRKTLEHQGEPAVAVQFAGARDADLASAIEWALAPAIVVGDASAEPDLVLFVRTDGTLQDMVADGYAELTTPQLLLDLAYGHTICLGPLVFPGETACLSCLVGRLSYYWGDIAPPPRPRMVAHHALSAGLVALAITNILLHADRGLVNRTVAYDFAGHETQANSVYRLPMCPCCGLNVPDDGSVALPWAGAR